MIRKFMRTDFLNYWQHENYGKTTETPLRLGKLQNSREALFPSAPSCAL
jgi:hypothetical protein